MPWSSEILGAGGTPQKIQPCQVQTCQAQNALAAGEGAQTGWMME